MTRKTKSPSEIAKDELIDLSETIANGAIDRIVHDERRWWPEDLPPPPAGSWPILQLVRLLNLLADEGKVYAFTWVLSMWLERTGVRIPKGVFSKNTGSRRLGRVPSRQKREFGEKAFNCQIKLIAGPLDKLLSDDEVRQKRELIQRTKPGFKASQIARELLSIQYLRGGASRDAARKRVAEAIATVKPSASQIAKRERDNKFVSDWIEEVMGAQGLYG